MTQPTRWMIVQIAQASAPSDSIGTLAPVNADGFYGDYDMAAAVAEQMAERAPDLETYVVQVVERVR